MTNEEILMAVQSSQQENDEYEKTIVRKSIAYGTAVGIVICLAMILTEMIVAKKMDFGKPALLFAIEGAAELYEGLKSDVIKKKILGIIILVVAVLWIGLYIGALFI